MATSRPTAAGRGFLPAELTSFVGRRRQLGEARRLLAGNRMLTLTGPGGVGKTRLALRLAAEVRRAYPDGCWFVELAALRDPQLLAQAIANALELRQVSPDPATDLAQYLEPQRLLVVLDNCEHLTDAVALLAGKLLAAAPGLQVLATSRHVVGVEGEQILTVPPLPTPRHEVAAGDATHYDAVRLFLDRASAVAPDFAISDANRDVVVELCRKLDGIPLAIELAVVWLRVLSPAQILDRLEDRYRLLGSDGPPGSPRQRAMDATVGWSHDLCSPAEQLLWARLSVFSGGFDLEAAEDVCSGGDLARDDVLHLLASLVNKSIVVRRHASDQATAWYEMLEIIRQYGAARLDDAGRTSALRARHRDHYGSLARRYAAESFGPRQQDWFVRLRREHGNLRAALEFCLDTPGEAAGVFEIAAPLWNFWFAGLLREGYQYLVRALELAPEPTAARAHALWAASYLGMFVSDWDRHDAMLEECARIAAGLDDPLLDARIQECRGHGALYRADLPTAVAGLAEARSAFRAIGDPLGEFDTLILLSAGAFFLEDPRVDEFSRDALALAERHGATSSTAYGLWSVGIARWRSGDYAGATDSFRRAVRLFQTMHDLTGTSFGVQGLSWCAAFRDRDVAAARLLGGSQAVWRASGTKIDETNAYSVVDQRAEDLLREVLGDQRFEAAFAEGAAYSSEQAVATALGEDAPVAGDEKTPARRRRPEAPGGLTKRELEIAGLLAEGLTNREIAARLVISHRTAETHVDNILSKLGLTSRSLVASWLAEHESS